MCLWIAIVGHSGLLIRFFGGLVDDRFVWEAPIAYVLSVALTTAYFYGVWRLGHYLFAEPNSLIKDKWDKIAAGIPVAFWFIGVTVVGIPVSFMSAALWSIRFTTVLLLIDVTFISVFTFGIFVLWPFLAYKGTRWAITRNRPGFDGKTFFIYMGLALIVPLTFIVRAKMIPHLTPSDSVLFTTGSEPRTPTPSYGYDAAFAEGRKIGVSSALFGQDNRNFKPSFTRCAGESIKLEYCRAVDRGWDAGYELGVREVKELGYEEANQKAQDNIEKVKQEYPDWEDLRE